MRACVVNGKSARTIVHFARLARNPRRQSQDARVRAKSAGTVSLSRRAREVHGVERAARLSNWKSTLLVVQRAS
jgi:hypothetical protein